jgi:hypothetical protein
VTIDTVQAAVTYSDAGTVVFNGPVPNDWTGVETAYAVVISAGDAVYAYTVTVFDAITPDTATWASINVRARASGARSACTDRSLFCISYTLRTVPHFGLACAQMNASLWRNRSPSLYTVCEMVHYCTVLCRV